MEFNMNSYEYMYNHLKKILGEIQYEYDDKTNVTTWEGKFKQILGYDSMPVTQEEFMSKIHPDCLKNISAVIEYSLKTGEPWNIEFKYPKADGEYIWLRSIAFLFFEEGNPKVSSIKGFLKDINSEKLITQELINVKTNLSNAQNFAHLGSWEYDFITKRSYWSNEFYRLHGYEIGEVEPNLENCLVRIHKDDREYVESSLKNSLHFGTEFKISCRLVLPNGITRNIRCSGQTVKDESGNNIKFISTVLDITDMTYIQKELQKSDQLHYSILSALDEGVLVIDDNYRIILVNKWFTKYTGIDPVEYIGKEVFRLFPKTDTIIDYLSKAISGEKLNIPERKYTSQNNNDLYYIATVSPFRFNGTFKGALAIFKDVTLYRKVKILSELNNELNNLIKSQDGIVDKMKNI